MSTQTVMVATPKGMKPQKATTVGGEFAITPFLARRGAIRGRYTITHHPTGLALVINLKIKQAKVILEAVATIKYEAGSKMALVQTVLMALYCSKTPFLMEFNESGLAEITANPDTL